MGLAVNLQSQVEAYRIAKKCMFNATETKFLIHEVKKLTGLFRKQQIAHAAPCPKYWN